MESKLLEEKVINVSPHHPHVRVRGEEKVKEKYYPAVGWCSGWALWAVLTLHSGGYQSVAPGC